MTEYITVSHPGETEDISLEDVMPVLVDKLFPNLVPKVSIGKKQRKLLKEKDVPTTKTPGPLGETEDPIPKPTTTGKSTAVKRKTSKSQKIVGLSSYMILLVSIISYLNFLLFRKLFGGASQRLEGETLNEKSKQ